MGRSGQFRGNGFLVMVGLIFVSAGPAAGESATAEIDQAEHARTPIQRAQAIAAARLAQAEDVADPVPSDPVQTMTPGPGPDPQSVQVEIPSPQEARDWVRRTPPEDDEEQDERDRFLNRLDRLDQPKSVRLTLDEAIQRSIENNYAIRVQTYNPAIEATRIVEAESAFDAVYFANISYNKQDRPSSSALIGTASDARNLDTGVRKLLSTGATVQASYALNRQSSNLAFQTLNPAYFNQFIVEMRQPFLRGFGLDFNRSRIELARLDQSITTERMRREIREVVYNVEQAYWRLVQSRREVVIGSRLLASLETIQSDLVARQDLDAYPIQINQTKSRIALNAADFNTSVNQLRNAETALKSLMNDPDLNLADDVEIIPVTLPSIEPMVIDQLGEVTTALAHRAELHEAKLTIEKAQIAIGAAKNQALPRLDLLFRYIVDGLGGNADQAFSQLSRNDFHEYLVTLQFEWPIGNRGPEAAVRRARLQQAQAIAAHGAAIENVIREVKVAIRDLVTAYDQIVPTLEASQASVDQLRAIKIRQIRRDAAALQVELDANQQLAGARRQLLQAIIEYNIAIANLERQKGTLLNYNNIVIKGLEDYDSDSVELLAP